uniref:hypothetical protein n=1 Tax=Pedobacter schmidteae TaxID=2201271 RepID=UPI000EAEC67A|nr:hypothetical protein [Pedobacter schmidteae]
MATSDLHHQDLEINFNLKGTYQTIQITPEETTDGAAYYNCSVKGKNITQIRKEKEGDWEQIWGELDHQTVNAIGKAISQQLS